MKKITLLIFQLFFLLLPVTQAEVWHATQSWDQGWENEYQAWINNNLTTDIFTRKDGVLAGISTDCADALYDVRILFSYEHSLPFIINAPEVLQDKIKIFGNNTSMFDSIKDERARVRAFINFINDEVGTETLAKDTFPVKIQEINSGIVYYVEWSLFGKLEHHSYIVKGFDSEHELLYYASDAPRKVRKLQIDKKYPRFSYSEAPFGFRRWRHPEYILTPEKAIPEAEGYSNEQYELLAKVGKKEILKEIRKRLQN